MKTADIEFGKETLAIQVPDRADILTLPAVVPLAAPTDVLRRGLAKPIGARPLALLTRERVAQMANATAAIVVSDNTRPVPYGGKDGVLAPILDVLQSEGIAHIDVIVATGTHRGMTRAELQRMLPPQAFGAGVDVVNHECNDADGLRCIGRTGRGTEAWVNARYLDADIKILTGLVEPHFMAGFSGGRKSICPGLIGLETTHIFHGATMMADPSADSLVLAGNPCHEEALEVAQMAGCDFTVNVTIDRHKRITGVFCGDMETAHAAACAKALETNAIPIEHEYDVVITHAGFAGINHYQAAKAACEASKAVKPGGHIIMAANHTDVHPVGSEHYRSVLPMLTELGPERFNARILSPDWTFVPEQWEVQKWAQVFGKLGAAERLVYCAPQLTGDLFVECAIPGVDGGLGLPAAPPALHAKAMIQHAVDGHLSPNRDSTFAVLADGPYGVPVRP